MDIIVTGSTGGIGSCIVSRAVRSCMAEKVYCLYRDEEKFDSMAYRGHSKIVPVKHDASWQTGDQYFFEVLKERKACSIAFVHTAFSILPIERIGMYSQDDIRRNISLNVMDLVFLVNGLLRLKKAGSLQLRIINIDSGAAYKPLEGWGLYSAAKAYANMFLRTVQLEEPDVKVVSYEPGVVDTPMQKQIRSTDDAACAQAGMFREYSARGMLRSPDAVAEDIFARFIERWDGKHFNERHAVQ